jgi:esterase/lipase superfamily enzyme
MPITVYFATNRVVTDSANAQGGYTDAIVPANDPTQITYATAFVKDANLTADTIGAISSIQDVTKGGFSAQAADDLSTPGRNLLVFIHGFANSFENAITRAAFNQQWLAASGVAGAATTVIAFSWPSLGREIGFPLLTEPYRHDQNSAIASAAHLVSFFSNLLPVVTAARGTGRRAFLLAHSMGNLALSCATSAWFAAGNGAASLFDEAILAAGDAPSDCFANPPPGPMSGLRQLARRVSIYYSQTDQLLALSATVNPGPRRLGQRGPLDMLDPGAFPPPVYRMVDASGIEDYDFGFASSHQYYRRSPTVRGNIASAMA